MKKLIGAIALVTVVTAPAFAKTPKLHDAAQNAGITAARAYDGPDYVGQDPDSRIQSELRRDTAADRGA